MTSNRTGFGNKYFMRHIQINYWSPKYKSEGNCTQLNPEAINSLLHHVHYCSRFFVSVCSTITFKVKGQGLKKRSNERVIFFPPVLPYLRVRRDLLHRHEDNSRVRDQKIFKIISKGNYNSLYSSTICIYQYEIDFN